MKILAALGLIFSLTGSAYADRFILCNSDEVGGIRVSLDYPIITMMRGMSHSMSDLPIPPSYLEKIQAKMGADKFKTYMYETPTDVAVAAINMDHMDESWFFNVIGETKLNCEERQN